ncbi:phenol hydroxylase-like protein [Niveomyces insectorum RCEF 264]|uniref:Phenol hydroxylase-like protein n=1 Tax=Niveomyces insectorum RCEF 264 TaxID=1081102 RepID=A0A167SJG9_9HYPO|nr:phenol hydroxylase-like protein [Niveomyces insectorum RCEF 264]
MDQPVPCYDIVIVGAGPAGLMLSTLLARWGYSIKHIDDRAEPTPTGRADGIQPRSLDLLRNMGLKAAIMAHKPARVYEVAFWDPPRPHAAGIVRTGTWASCPGFIDARYPFTTLLHQGHIERVFLADLAQHGVAVQRPWTIRGFSVRSAAAGKTDYPVEIDLAPVDDDGTAPETVRAKYLFGGEGARSFVRQQLGIRVRHKDPIAYVWGVMDGVVDTDFPDIKMKCTIHSQDGSVMVIPREDDMVRLYIQIASSTDPDWDPRKTATKEQVQASAKKILQPYYIEWERVEWYSVYPIGQGIADHYTLDHRVFIGGDACHTHSPKAGQGMNTAFLDAQNLACKIHLVEQGFADRRILETYELERKQVAETLLAFDNQYAKLFSAKPDAASAGAAVAGSSSSNNNNNTTATHEDTEFVRMFKENCAFTSGYGVAYPPSALTWSPGHAVVPSALVPPPGCALRPGRLLANADVTRVVDANVVHLLRDLDRGMRAQHSFYAAYRRPDSRAVVPRHEKHTPHSGAYTVCVVFARPRPDIDIARDVPGVLAAYRDHVYADDRGGSRSQSQFQSSQHGNTSDDRLGAAHAKCGLDPERGGVVVVRPDGYVGIVVGLAEGSGTVDALNGYFGSFCTKKLGHASSRI